jgi:hypothetical protein
VPDELDCPPFATCDACNAIFDPASESCDCPPCTVPGCGEPDPCDDCAAAGGWF